MGEKKTIIYGKGDKTCIGTIHFNSWSQAERKKRAVSQTVKIVGGILAFSLIGLFVHILIPVLIVLDVLALLAAFPLYMKFSGEKETLSSIEGQCPLCDEKGKLKPYVQSDIQQWMTIQCDGCGETMKMQVQNSLSSGDHKTAHPASS